MTSITYTAVLDVGRETAETLALLLREHRDRLGTRKNTRALSVFKQGILVLRWFVDGTRLAQLSRDSRISVPTAYRYLHEGLTVLADHAPDLATALERAAAAGYTHLNLDGTVIHTDRVAAPRSQRGRSLVVREAQASWRECAGHLRPGRLAALGVPGPPRPRARHHLRAHPRPDRRAEPARRHSGTSRL